MLRNRISNRFPGDAVNRWINKVVIDKVPTKTGAEEIDVGAAAKLLQSCPTLWDPIDSSPPGSPIPRILQARTLEWVAISFLNA